MMCLMGGVGSGGARVRSGPAADPNALRRQKDGKEWVKLPAAGRQGEPPEWPDEVISPTQEEITLWNRVWTSPQAIIWEADQVNDTVALYCRVYLEAMAPRASALARTFAKQMMGELYLTGPALASGRYVIEQTAEAKAIDAAVEQGEARKSARQRMKVVPITVDHSGEAPEEIPF